MLRSLVDFRGSGILVDDLVRSLTVPAGADLARLRAFAAGNARIPPLDERDWRQILETQADLLATGALVRWFLERASGFDSAQRRAIREFLEFMRDVHGDEFPQGQPETALQRFWDQ